MGRGIVFKYLQTLFYECIYIIILINVIFHKNCVDTYLIQTCDYGAIIKLCYIFIFLSSLKNNNYKKIRRLKVNKK